MNDLTCREQLEDWCCDILPSAPESLKGPEVIKILRDRGHNGFSDSTLRYHMSILSVDSGSRICKVDHGQGYYLAPPPDIEPTEREELQALQAHVDAMHGVLENIEAELMQAKALTARLESIRERHPLPSQSPHLSGGRADGYETGGSCAECGCAQACDDDFSKLEPGERPDLCWVEYQGDHGQQEGAE